jgi:predicted nucleic acid-binding protein
MGRPAAAVTIALDTSVLCRLLTRVPPAEAAVAEERLALAHEAGELVVVTDLALAETYHALIHHYGLTKAEARTSLRALARSGAITLSPPDVLPALDPAPGAGVVDRLLHLRHARERLTTVTFDRKMAALPGAVRLR